MQWKCIDMVQKDISMKRNEKDPMIQSDTILTFLNLTLIWILGEHTMKAPHNNPPSIYDQLCVYCRSLYISLAAWQFSFPSSPPRGIESEEGGSLWWEMIKPGVVTLTGFRSERAPGQIAGAGTRSGILLRKFREAARRCVKKSFWFHVESVLLGA